MKRLVTVLVGLCLVGVVAFLLLQERPPDPDAGSVAGARHDAASPDPRLQGRGAPAPDAAPPPAGPAPDADPWRLTGRVLDPGGQPVSGATVVAWLDPGAARSVIGKAASGDDGAYVLPLAALARTSPAQRVTSALVAAATMDGFRPGEEAEIRPLPLDVAGGLDLTLDLTLVPGGRIVGTAIGADDAPLAEVSVHLVASSGEVLDSMETDAPGTFALGFTGEPTVELWAVSRIHGLARTGPLEPDPTGTTDVGTLRLVQGASIEGRVLYADRTPVEGAWVYANLEEPADDPYAAVSPHVVWTQIGAETDAQGRFAMQAFRPGSYRFQVGHAFGVDLEVLAHSGDHDVEIVLPLHKLVVRVHDAEGAALPGCYSLINGWMAGAREDFEQVASGKVDLRRGQAGGQVAIAGAVSYADGRIQLLVPPGSAWVFLFELEGLPPLEHIARIPEEGNETHVELVAGAHGPTGALQIDLLDAYDAEIEIFDFELTTRLGGALAEGGSRDPDSLRGLPTGPARLRVHPGPARHRMDRHCQFLSPYFTLDTDVEITAGGTSRVTLRARMGGWISLTPELEGEVAEDALGGVRVDVRSVGSEGPWTNAWMFVYGEGDDVRGTSRLAPNVPTRLGQLFEPGAQELRLLGHGFEPVTVPVTVVPGEEVSVVVRVRRR